MSLINVNHPLHPQHTLAFTPSGEPFRCSGCNQKGLFRCHICPHGCAFRLHDACANPEPSAYFHPLMEKCELRLHHSPCQPGTRLCVACGKEIQGFVYQCSTHKEPHDIHPHCLKLPLSKADFQGDVTVHLRKKPPMKCLSCNRKKVNPKITGWCYASTCGQFCYHVACAMELHIKNWMVGQLERSGDATKIDSLALEIVDPCHSVVVRWRKKGPQCSKAERFWKMLVVVFKLVVSALFGDPITATATVVGLSVD